MKVYQINWNLSEDNEKSMPNFIFAKNIKEAMNKFNQRFKQFENVKLKSLNEVQWKDIKETINVHR